MMISSSHSVHEPLRKADKWEVAKESADTAPTRFVDFLNGLHRPVEATSTAPTPAIVPNESEVQTDEDSTVADSDAPPQTTSTEEGEHTELRPAVPPAFPSITPTPPTNTDSVVEAQQDVPETRREAVPVTLPTPKTNTNFVVEAQQDVPETRKEAVPVTLPTPKTTGNATGTMGTATITTETPDSALALVSGEELPQTNSGRKIRPEGPPTAVNAAEPLPSTPEVKSTDSASDAARPRSVASSVLPATAETESTGETVLVNAKIAEAPVSEATPTVAPEETPSSADDSGSQRDVPPTLNDENALVLSSTGSTAEEGENYRTPSNKPEFAQERPQRSVASATESARTTTPAAGATPPSPPPTETTSEGDEVRLTETPVTDGDDPDSPTIVRPSGASERHFPRTLNALFAEHAIRARQASTASLQHAVESLTEPLESTSTSQTVDEPTPAGATPTSPTAALESGGVRLSSTPTGPRIPLANLPGEIAQQIHRIRQEGSTTLHLRISPENLGELRLEVHREGDAVRVSMVSSNPQVREALESQLHDLRRALSQQGFNLSDASVEDGSTSRHGHGSHSRQTTEHGHRNDRPYPPGRAEATETLHVPLDESPRITSDSINVLA